MYQGREKHLQQRKKNIGDGEKEIYVRKGVNLEEVYLLASCT